MKTVFFDLDDTLYSRGQPFVEAAGICFGEQGLDYYAVYLACVKRGNEKFQASQTGEMTMDAYNIYRYGKGFADMGFPISDAEALRFREEYQRRQKNVVLSPTVREILERGSRSAGKVGILTNGTTIDQWSKIRVMGIERYCARDWIVVSGDVGVDKPDLRIFRHVEALTGRKPEELVYVGDSLTHDIIPARAAGWQAVWFNRRRAPLRSDCIPDFTVQSEEELLSVLKSIYEA